jgi:TonB family protein
LLVTINREGRPRPVRVQGSSGSIDLDEIAQDWAVRMRFSPCLKDGTAVPAELTLTIEWQRAKRP